MTMADPEPGKPEKEEEGFKIPYYVALTTYMAYAILFIIGHCRDFLRSLLGTGEKAKEVRFLFRLLCTSRIWFHLRFPSKIYRRE